MRNVLLVLGYVTDEQCEPLRMAMARDKLSPVVVRVPLQHRNSGLVRKLVVVNNSLTLAERITELERECLVSLLTPKGASLQDVKVVLTEFRPTAEGDASPWEWVDHHLPRQGVRDYRLRLSPDGQYYWLDGLGFARVSEIQIPA